MKFAVVKCIVLLLVAAAAEATEFDEEDDVIVLDGDNFQQGVEQLSPIFVDFYTPGCGHCEKLAPTFSELAREMKKKGSKVKLAKIDATQDRDKYNITRGFPTMRFFASGGKTIVEFPPTGERTVAYITKWLGKKLGPAATKVESIREVERIMENEPLVVLGFFKDNKKSDENRAFMSVAFENDDYEFLYTTKKSVADEYNLNVDSVAIFRQFDERRLEMKEPVTVDSLRRFLDKFSRPLVQELNPQTGQKLYQGTLRYHLTLFLNKTSPDFQAHIETLTDVAHLYRGKLIVAYLDVEELWTKLGMYGVKVNECPVAVFIDLDDGYAKYRAPVGHQLTTGKLALFVQNAFDGKLKKFVKSETLPADWDSRSVKMLVNKNLLDVVTKPTKNVFVKFYAPWCHHCQEMAPMWETLAEKYQRNANVMLAEFNTAENDIPAGVKTMGVPTVVMFPKGGGQAIMYKGSSRTFDDLVRFIDSDGKIMPIDEKDDDIRTEL